MLQLIPLGKGYNMFLIHLFQKALQCLKILHFVCVYTACVSDALWNLNTSSQFVLMSLLHMQLITCR